MTTSTQTKRLGCMCLLLLALGHIPKTYAQDKPDEIPKRSWEVGMDVLGLVGKSNFIVPYTFQVRRNYETQNHQHRALRLRVGTDFSSRTKLLPRESLNFLSRIGYEFQKPVQSPNTYMYYGLDASYEVKEILKDQLLAFFNSPYPMVLIPSRERYIGLNGFIGVKYFINSSISISTESTLSVLHRSYYDRSFSDTGSIMLFKDKSITLGNQPLYSLEYVPKQSTMMRLVPLQTINFSFHF